MRDYASEEIVLETFETTYHELVSIIEAHTYFVQSWLSSRSQQAETFQGKGIRASSTGFKLPLLNLALGCEFPIGSTEEEIQYEIEEIKRFFSRRHVPWYWWLNPLTSPKNIRSILEKRGLAHDVHPLPAMAASLKQDRSNFPQFPEEIKIWQARAIPDLKFASKIRRVAFKFREGEAMTYFEDMAPDWLENDSVKLFLAGVDELEPVSIGAMILGAGIPGIYVMATLPDHQQKGFGKAILTRLMSEAGLQGHAMILLTASKAGFGLYSQFGFHHIFDFNVYSFHES